jgi:hypothetical protein
VSDVGHSRRLHCLPAVSPSFLCFPTPQTINKEILPVKIFLQAILFFLESPGEFDLLDGYIVSNTEIMAGVPPAYAQNRSLKRPGEKSPKSLSNLPIMGAFRRAPPNRQRG